MEQDPAPDTLLPWQQTAPVPEAYSRAIALLERTVTDCTAAAVLPELVTAIQHFLDEQRRAGDDAEGR